MSYIKNCYIESSDSSVSLLSGSRAFVPACETPGFVVGGSAAFFLALRAFSPTSSCSAISACKNVGQGTYRENNINLKY